VSGHSNLEASPPPRTDGRCSTLGSLYALDHPQQHRRRLPQDNGGDCPRRKTPHRAPPPCEELDPAYDIKLVFMQKITSVLSKIDKNCCHQSCTFSLQYAPNCLSAAASPQTQLGELTAPRDLLAVFRGPTSKERGGT